MFPAIQEHPSVIWLSNNHYGTEFLMQQTLRDQVKEAVDNLPQRGIIPDAVAERWIDGILKLDPERALWHVNRARGFGGSEIGELLLERNGEKEYLKSATNIINDKLLITLPDRENIYMARGAVLEIVSDSVYHRLMGSRSIKNDPSVRDAFNKPGSKPFVVGNPDDVTRSREESLVIPDFKVRSNLDWDSDLPFTYVCQLHWYGHIYDHNAEPSEPIRYALGELDIPSRMADEVMWKLESDKLTDAQKQSLIDSTAETVANLNLPGLGMRITSFDRNFQLEKDLVDTAEWFWNNHVMEGKPYMRPGTTLESDVPDEVKEQVHSKMNLFLKSKLGNKVGDQVAKDAQKEVIALLDRYDLSNWPFKVPGLTHSQGNKFDAESAARALIAKGHPADSLRKHKAESLDLEKAEATLKAHGLLHPDLYKPSWDATAVKKAVSNHDSLKVEDFHLRNVRTALSAKKEDKETLSELESAMKVHLYRFKESEEPYPEDLSETEDSEKGPSLA
jgi:hypothetical protein